MGFFSRITALADCCEIISDNEFWITDNYGDTSEICTKVDGQLYVKNPQKKDVDFLKVDGCIFNSAQGKRCDCALSTDLDNYFVEFKEKRDFSNEKGKKNARKKANLQLIASVNHFKPHNIDLGKTFAVIVLTPVLPHSYSQVVTTAAQFEIAQFMSQTGCPNLIEGNIIDI